MTRRTKGSGGQDPKGSAVDEEDEDLEETASDEDSQDDEEEDEEEDQPEESASDEETESPLDKLPKETKDELLRLRKENKRRREANRALREQLRAAEVSRSGKPSADDLEKENSTLRSKVLDLTVGSELRDYIAENHPQYSALSKRIAKFVDLEDVDPSDPDSVRDAVATATEEFVKEVPIKSSMKVDDEDAEERPVKDQNGRVVGSASGRPARKSASDKSSETRRKTMFPGIYSGPKA